MGARPVTNFSFSSAPQRGPIDRKPQPAEIQQRGFWDLPVQPPGKCQWIEGEAGQRAKWCKGETTHGPWCEEHRRRVYIKRPDPVTA